MPGAVVPFPVPEQVVPEDRGALKDDKEQAAAVGDRATSLCGDKTSQTHSLFRTAQSAFTFWGHTAAPTSGNTVAPPAATSLIYNTDREAQRLQPGLEPANFLHTNVEVK